LTESDFILSNFDISKTSNGSVTWKTPSNIALVKYWGKQEPQIPENTSISFTLDACFTLTTLEFKLKTERSRSAGSQDEMLKQACQPARQVQNDRTGYNFDIYFEGKKGRFQTENSYFF